MNEGLIPRRYAKALYEAALEAGSDQRVYDLMKTLSAAFDAEPQLQQVVKNPFVTPADKTAIIATAAAAEKSDSIFFDFIKLLLKNRRIGSMRDIALAYMDCYRKAHNIYVVKVTSAAPLSDTEEKRLQKFITAHLNGGSMEYSQSVDPELIGGFVVNVGNERIDASISNELKQLRLNLISK